MIKVQVVLEKGNSKKIIMSEGKNLLASAEESYKKGDYLHAYQLANRARGKI